MATFRNDLPYLPSLRDGSPRAAQLRRRYAVGGGLLLFFFGMLAAAGLGQLVGILVLILIAAGAGAFLRDRRRREWLRRRLAPAGRRAALAARGQLRSVVARGASLRARGLRRVPDLAQRLTAARRPDVAADPEAPTAERTDVGESPPSAIPPDPPGIDEPSGITDHDALRCQAFGMQLRRSGDPQRAIPLHQSARVIFAETGNRRGEALAMNGLGLALAAAGDHEAALPQFDEARRLLHELGDDEREGKVLVNLGQVKLQLGAAEEATELLRAAQEKFEPDTYPYQLVEQHLR